jgi:hypothetical protein
VSYALRLAMVIISLWLAIYSFRALKVMLQTRVALRITCSIGGAYLVRTILDLLGRPNASCSGLQYSLTALSSS